MALRIAQIKVCPEKGKLEINQQRLMGVLNKLSSHSPDVVVTPECFLDGYVSTEKSVTKKDIAKYAINPSNSIYTKAITSWAKKNKSWVIYGCTRIEKGKIYNTALIFDRKGKIIGSYDKVHCQTHDHKYSAGSRLPVFKSDFGPFGILICADRRWPEAVRTLALKGARIIFNPTYGMHDERNLHMMQTRSYESEVFIAFTHPKQSLITGPVGEVVVIQNSEDRSYTITEIDLAEVDKARTAEYAHLRDRRPELYK